jgi:hypothetical protein
MPRKRHVPFLGEGVAVMSPPYPTLEHLGQFGLRVDNQHVKIYPGRHARKILVINIPVA